MNQSDYYFHSIDPVAIEIFGFAIYWYSLMYLVAFGAFWLLGRIRARREDAPMQPHQVGDFLFWGVIGVIVGGRFGYVLFYGFDQLMADPLFLFMIRDGGMSFHGGLLGALVAVWGYGRHLGCGFLRLGDFTAPLVPIGLAAGRLGNFIGGNFGAEPLMFHGRSSAVHHCGAQPASTLYDQYLAGALDEFARHPSQIYQAALEGLALFVILWLYSARPRPTGAVGGAFLAGYGVFRFIAEFFREPDAHLGYVALDWMTMGQILSLPMFVAGIALMTWAYRSRA